MIKLNRKVEYALIALKHMSSKMPGELTTAKEVCSQNGSPFDATARVMQIMAQNGLLKSEQGAHGGYLVQMDLSRVSVSDLNNWILGPQALVKCLEKGDDACEMKGTCNFASPAAFLNQKMFEFLTSITVKEIITAGDFKIKKITKPKVEEIRVQP